MTRIGLVVLLLSLVGCSSGPQIPVVTTPLIISCTWHGQDGGTVTDNDCLIDRSTADGEADSVGNQVEDVTANPQVETDVGL